jgi:hypothetical protein
MPAHPSPEDGDVAMAPSGAPLRGPEGDAVVKPPDGRPWR